MNRIVRDLMFLFDPEKTHNLIIQILKYFGGTPLDWIYRQRLPHRPIKCMGLNFRNPVGLAAGFDKNGECLEALDAMGFGFVEVGTVTPRPQFGNDKPRLFRLIEAQGMINRMGFNNLGVDHLVENIKSAKFSFVLGVNIGKNEGTPIEKSEKDYLICMEKVYEYADYITINISSPNTEKLRSLQYGESLNNLLTVLKIKQKELLKKHAKYVPLTIKISPDLNPHEISKICQSLIKNNIDGVIATNTTLDKTVVNRMKYANEIGGLSGKPIQTSSTKIVLHLHKELGNDIPIIGVGGVDSCISAREKLISGATLIQIYSGFIYYGPKLLKEIIKNL
ncbi:dihydroorotate dehydrogenase [Candidatus Photodesmus katoptron]|uniref:Dihydroorotate dehydrogenase (quinone) n=2 Tax=Candidatus Photodesmus anomalopis TaxID=28176 RepID=S3DGM1_9GAMM|nr:dihydroorotate oxidase [Candidatus Photodesmus katoptron Akat1]KEY90674.1 dihydroorotate dehydrogenase [Candidatus Photodesmus katoptron]